MKNIETKTIITNRLILRKFKIEDANEMYHNWATDLYVVNFYIGMSIKILKKLNQ